MGEKTHPQALSVAFLRGATVGALVLTIFGTYWEFMTLSYSAHPPTWAFVATGLISLSLASFCIQRLITVSKLSTSLSDPEGSRNGRRQGLWFGIIFIFESLFIAVTAILLANADLPSMIPIAVAAIVGLHFLPLAKLFGVPLYYLTGLSLFGFACASLIIPNEILRLDVLGTAVAIVLWTSAMIILIIYPPSSSLKG